MKRRKIVLWAGIPLAVIIIALLAVNLVYLSKMRLETRQMAPLDSGEVINGVYVIKSNSYTNFYLVESESDLVAFDSGAKKKIIKKEMAELGLDPLKVTAVFLTHTDDDHTGGLKLLSNATVYISDEEEQMIDGTTTRMFLFKNSLPRSYNLLTDNQDIDVSGLRVHCILTPGHTPGSLCYVVNDKYLFTGDTLSLKNNKVDLFNDYYNMDAGAERDSITRISRLSGIEYIFTVHYGYSDDYQESFSGWNGN